MIGKLGDAILWQRAKTYIRKYQPILVGVAGGHDKTLAREAITLALSTKYKRVRSIDTDTSSPRDVALAILGERPQAHKNAWWRSLIGSKVHELSEKEPEVIVIEVAVDKPGDIDQVAREFGFSHAVILNVASTHLDLFGSKQNVAHELLSLPISIPREGVAVLNADDSLVAAMPQHLMSNVVTFGQDVTARVRLVRVDRVGVSGFVGEIEIKGKRYEFSIPHVVGRHQLTSVLAAIGLSHGVGLDISKVIHALHKLQLPEGHMRILVGRQNSTILDDSHDASFESMQTALKTLVACSESVPQGATKPRRIVILGDITGLGGQSIPAHETIGREVASLADVFIAVGEEMKHAQAQVLKQGGIDTHHFNSSKDVGKWFASYVQPNDMILIKGSRDMRMEETTRALLEHPEEDSQQLVKRV